VNECEFCEKWLDWYLDGVLPPPDSRAFEEHIASSDVCRRRLEAEEKWLTLLGERLPVRDVSEKVMERLGLGRGAPFWTLRRILVPLAAGFLIVVGALFLFRGKPSPPASKEPIGALWQQAEEVALTMRQDTRDWYRAGFNMFTGDFLVSKGRERQPGQATRSENEFI